MLTLPYGSSTTELPILPEGRFGNQASTVPCLYQFPHSPHGSPSSPPPPHPHEFPHIPLHSPPPPPAPQVYTDIAPLLSTSTPWVSTQPPSSPPPPPPPMSFHTAPPSPVSFHEFPHIALPPPPHDFHTALPLIYLISVYSVIVWKWWCHLVQDSGVILRPIVECCPHHWVWCWHPNKNERVLKAKSWIE